MIDIIEKMKTEMFRRKYSIRTIDAYCDVVKIFLRKTNIEDVRRIKKSDIKDYLNSLHDKSGNTINVHLSALKFMMEEILHRNCYVHIRYSKTPQRVPEYLTKEEILKLFAAMENPKHRLMIKLMYSAGLRVSELLNLKISNFDFEINQGWVIQGKGNKDRIFIIANGIKNELINFIKENKSKRDDYIFTSYAGRMSARTVQEILKEAARKSGIKKRVHPHMLRHSFATHLMQNGYDGLTVQSLLGHSDIRTTMIYSHVVKPKLANVVSPLDNL